MRRLAIETVAALLFVAAFTVHAEANTASPCKFHGASTPYVSSVNDGVVTLAGAGSIGGCPIATTTAIQSVAVTVCIQHLDGSQWTNRQCASFSRAWNRYYRFSRQAGGNVYATCEPGEWRIDVTGGDGFAPYEWSSPVAMFTSSDGYTCSEIGGAD